MSTFFRRAIAVICAIAVIVTFGLVALEALRPAIAADTTLKLFDRAQLQVHTDTATINSATANYANWQPILTITPDSSNANALQDVTVAIDLNQATTGFGAVYTSGTISFSIQRKIDGTNWREEDNLKTTAISGTNAGAATGSVAVELRLGLVGPGESVRVVAIISSVSNTNVTLPLVLYYRAPAKATVTAAS